MSDISVVRFYNSSLDCPGFGQDRVNFHQEPGGNTAGRADPTRPNRAGHSVPCAVMQGFSWGSCMVGCQLGNVRRQQAVRVALFFCLFVLCILLICIVVVTVPFLCCSVKLPLSRPTSFCLFLSILLCTPAGGGAATWPFCCRPQPNYEKIHLHSANSVKLKLLLHFTTNSKIRA